MKLYVDEIGSEDAATSIVAYPETGVALARLRQSRDLSPANFSAVKRSFERQWPAFLALEVSAPLSREAGDFAERYALRGYDALHLASFAEIARRPAERRFSSFDDRRNKVSRHLARRLQRGR